MLRIIGLNHHSASVDVRERLAFSPSQTAAALAAWQDHTADIEAVLLSTCNRTEFYVASQNLPLPSVEQLLAFLIDQKQAQTKTEKELTQPIPVMLSQIFSFDNAEAVEHLFAVASSLDSMVLGEVQILSQVKNAYQLALDAETAGSTTHLLFQSALRTAKRVADETDLHRHRVSIPSIAVSDFALRVFEKLNDKKILIFGAGEMGEETLQYLAEHGAKSITVLNRHRERAESLAKQFGGGVADWSKRFEMMLNADIIVSATGSAEPVITLDDFQPIAAKRNGLPLFILDLAMPRDFDAAVGRCSGVYLYSLDDLQEACNQNRLARDKEIPKAERLVQVAAKEFLQEINHRKNGAVIQLLREQWSKTKDNELARLFNKLPELSGKQQGEIRYAFERLTAKFLHPPLESLRDESKNGEPQKLLEALAKLFKLR